MCFLASHLWGFWIDTVHQNIWYLNYGWILVTASNVCGNQQVDNVYRWSGHRRLQLPNLFDQFFFKKNECARGISVCVYSFVVCSWVWNFLEIQSKLKHSIEMFITWKAFFMAFYFISMHFPMNVIPRNEQLQWIQKKVTKNLCFENCSKKILALNCHSDQMFCKNFYNYCICW